MLVKNPFYHSSPCTVALDILEYTSMLARQDWHCSQSCCHPPSVFARVHTDAAGLRITSAANELGLNKGVTLG